MRIRGQKYWDWNKSDLHFRDHDERLDDGTSINIQVRHSPAVGVQLFIGVYASSGAMLFEEVYDSRPDHTMTQAIKWGVGRAYELIGRKSLRNSPDSAKPEPLPRKGSRSYK